MNKNFNAKKYTIQIGNKEFKIGIYKILDFPALMFSFFKNKFKFILVYNPRLLRIPGFDVRYDEPVFAIKFSLLFSIIFFISIKHKPIINPTTLTIILQLGLVSLLYYLLFI